MNYSVLSGLTLICILFVDLSGTTNAKEIHAYADNAYVELISSFKTAQDTLPEGGGDFPFKKSDSEWKQLLTSKEYRILRGGGTELPYVNELNDNKRNGIYICAGCGQKLYSSEHKYDSGTGWPSFWKPISDSLVAKRFDNSWFMTRIEIVCSNCGGHLGHVFDDGPQPTGLRYCMNSAAMDFIESKDVADN